MTKFPPCTRMEILHGIFIEQTPTRSCGLEMQKPTNACMSIKCLVITFDKNPKWERTLPLGISQQIFIGTPSQYISWNWTHVEVHNPTQALKAVTSQGNTFDWNPKWARTLPLGFFSGNNCWDPNIEVEIWHPAWDWDGESHLGT